VTPSASSFILQYLFLSLRSFSSCLILLPRLLFPPVFSSITCFRRHFLHKMLPFFLFIVCRTCLSFFLHSVRRFIFHTIGLTDVFHPCPASHLRSFSVILICSELFKFQHCSWLCSKCSISWAQCAEYKNRQALLSLWHSLVISENRNVLAKYHDQALNRNSSTRVLQRLRQRDYVHDFRTKFSRVPIDMLKIVDLIIISQIYGPQSLITLLRAVPALC